MGRALTDLNDTELRMLAASNDVDTNQSNDEIIAALQEKGVSEAWVETTPAEPEPTEPQDEPSGPSFPTPGSPLNQEPLDPSVQRGVDPLRAGPRNPGADYSSHEVPHEDAGASGGEAE